MHLRPRGSALTLHFLPCDCLIRPGLLISSERRELRINFALPFKAAAFLQLSNLASKATGDQSGGCGAQVRMRTRRAVGSRVACPESRLETTTPSASLTFNFLVHPHVVRRAAGVPGCRRLAALCRQRPRGHPGCVRRRRSLRAELQTSLAPAINRPTLLTSASAFYIVSRTARAGRGARLPGAEPVWRCLRRTRAPAGGSRQRGRAVQGLARRPPDVSNLMSLC